MIDNDYTGKETLEFLKDAINYNHFLEQELLGFIAPCARAADFGAGNGEFAARLQAQGKHITAIEADAQLRAVLSEKNIPNVSTISALEMQERIYSQNVLEHIEDDAAILRELAGKLTSGGKLFIYVPAFQCLYTDFDKAIGHHRRYRKEGLAALLMQSGFAVERAEYVDSVGFLCWMVMGKLPGDKTRINPLMIKLFDRMLFPLSRVLDKMTKNYFGKNLLVIGRKI